MHLGTPALCAGDGVGRSSDFPFSTAVSTPSRPYDQWPVSKPLLTVTAAGTVADLHRIPFPTGERLAG